MLLLLRPPESFAHTGRNSLRGTTSHEAACFSLGHDHDHTPKTYLIFLMNNGDLTSPIFDHDQPYKPTQSTFGQKKYIKQKFFL